MALTTTIILQSPYVVLSVSTAVGIFFEKGYVVGIVEQIYLGSYWAIGTKVIFKQEDIVRFKDSGDSLFLIDENKIYLSIPVVE